MKKKTKKKDLPMVTWKTKRCSNTFEAVKLADAGWIYVSMADYGDGPVWIFKKEIWS